jgi:hypothetical protein
MIPRKQVLAILVAVVVAMCCSITLAQPVSDTSFTYQGMLEQSGIAVTQQCDFEFSLWTGNAAPDPGVQIGSVVELTTDVNEGIFTAELDFGADVLNGAARWLHIAVCCPSGCAPGYTDLLPRQAITSAPYSIQTRGIYVDESMRVGIGTTTPNAMLTVGTGNGAAIQVGQQPQLYMSKDTVDDKFRIQLTGSGYGNYDFQIGRDDKTHDILFSGDVDVLGRVGIGLENPTSQTIFQSRVTGDDFGVLVDAQGSAGSPIGLHSGPSGYSSLAKNAYFASGWKKFNSSGGSYLQEVTPDGDVTFNVSPTGLGDAINWTNAMTMKSNGRIGMGTDNPFVKLHVIGSQTVSQNQTVQGNATIEGSLSIGYQVVEVECVNQVVCSAYCPGNKRAIAGGCTSAFDVLEASVPIGNGDGWFCRHDDSAGLTAYAICVRVN